MLAVKKGKELDEAGEAGAGLWWVSFICCCRVQVLCLASPSSDSNWQFRIIRKGAESRDEALWTFVEEGGLDCLYEGQGCNRAMPRQVQNGMRSQDQLSGAVHKGLNFACFVCFFAVIQDDMFPSRPARLRGRKTHTAQQLSESRVRVQVVKPRIHFKVHQQG